MVGKPYLIRRRGFSLIETLITVAIIGVLAGFAVPRINTQQYRADGAIRVVRGTLQQAHRLAIQRQHNVLVTFDVARGRMRTVDDVNDSETADADERQTWTVLAEGGRFAAPATRLPGGPAGAPPVASSSADVLNGLPMIVFRRNGVASADLDVYVAAGASRGDAYRAVRLTPATGRLDGYRLVANTWTLEGM